MEGLESTIPPELDIETQKYIRCSHHADEKSEVFYDLSRYLDMFFETGCDAIDPCEPPPDGDMELDEVKRRCAGHGVCVFGNIELKLLEHGTREQVRQEIRKVMEQAKADGGFVLVPTAGPINIPLSAKTAANYMAMIDAGLEFGVY